MWHTCRGEISRSTSLGKLTRAATKDIKIASFYPHVMQIVFITREEKDEYNHILVHQHPINIFSEPHVSNVPKKDDIFYNLMKTTVCASDL